MRRFTVCLFAALVFLPSIASADYPAYVEKLEREHAAVVDRQARGDVDLDEVRELLQERMLSLADRWMGTRWGLGMPQTEVPGTGKINCGMFVGTVLEDAGIVVNRKKLQRQPAELIIKTFSKPRDIERFRNTEMKEFLDGVREMGEGLYIIGLDFHVGFLLVTGEDVRFIHASYVTHTVIDEPADRAEPIVTSKYRVVGKLLDDRMVRRWLNQERFRVVGNW